MHTATFNITVTMPFESVADIKDAMTVIDAIYDECLEHVDSDNVQCSNVEISEKIETVKEKPIVKACGNCAFAKVNVRLLPCSVCSFCDQWEPKA